MGTRNTTRIYFNNELRVAQYGQWDGYPSGQGKDFMNFCASKYNMKALYNAIRNQNEPFLSSEELDVLERGRRALFREIDDSNLPMTSKDRITRYLSNSFEWHRDLGASILYRIAFGGCPVHMDTVGDELQEGNYEIWFYDNGNEDPDDYNYILKLEYHGHTKEINRDDLEIAMMEDEDFVDYFIGKWLEEINQVD